MTKEYTSLREKISAETEERRKRYQGFETAWAEAVTEGNKAAVLPMPTMPTTTAASRQILGIVGLF